MAICVAGQRIERVAICDDNQGTREALVDTIAAMDALPDRLESRAEGPLCLHEALEFVRGRGTTALLCDYLLKHRAYADFNGDELVAKCYDLRIPAVLCSQWAKEDIEDIRPLRSKIPALLLSEDLDEDAVMWGLETCIREMTSDYEPHRRPWRALVRVEDIADEYAYLILPSWPHREGVKLPLQALPESIRKTVEVGARYFAHVNVGAESASDLYFTNWECPSGTA